MQMRNDDEFGWFFRAIPLVLVPVFVSYFWFAPPRPKAPGNEAVFGCYSAPDAPNIILDGAGMHVLQIGFPIIGYHLERHKTGIVLAAERPIRSDRARTSYQFGIDAKGIGWFLPFYRIENGQIYGVFDASHLKSFKMLATDGSKLNYERAPETSCVPL